MSFPRGIAATALIGLIAIALTSAPALAQWPHDSELSLLIPSPGTAQYPHASEDGNGGAFVVYEDLVNQATEGINLRAHHVLHDGTIDPAWAPGRAICTATGNQNNAQVAADGAGGFYVVWQDYRGGTSDLYALRVNAAGSAMSGWNANGNLVGGIASKNDLLTSIGVASDHSLYIGWHTVVSGSDYDAYLTHVSTSGSVAAGWPSAGLNLRASSTAVQGNTVLSPLAAGGVVAAWEDAADGTFDIKGAKYSASGALQWSATFDNAPGNQYVPKIAEDNEGGVFVACENAALGQVNVARYTGSGTYINSNSLPITGVYESPLQVLRDGTNGAYIVYRTAISMPSAMYAILVHRVAGGTGIVWPSPQLLMSQVVPYTQIVSVPDGLGGLVCGGTSSDGTHAMVEAFAIGMTAVPPGWGSAMPVAAASSNKSGLSMVTDDENGAIAFWADNRGGTGYHIYAQRIARFGYLGGPDPGIVSVKDVLGDQGGQVRVSWLASYLDLPWGGEVASYRVWREVPVALARTWLAQDDTRLETPAAAATAPHPARRTLTTTQASGTVHYWEHVADVPALGMTAYSHVVSTTADSMSGSNPLTAVAVSSHTATGNYWWMSTPATGYSVDNLAPLTPAPFTGMLSGGTTFLHWAANGEPDLAGYRLYRGSSAAFVPGPATLIAALSDTGCTDAAVGQYYKLSAVDVHGNESPVAMLTPGGTVDAGEPIVRELALAPPMPNPVRARAMLRYALPNDADVRLAVYDAAGRLVRELESGVRAAGEHADVWDLRDARGHVVGAGLYFLRLRAGDRTLTRRLAVTR
jgi:hypothetical protein